MTAADDTLTQSLRNAHAMEKLAVETKGIVREGEGLAERRLKPILPEDMTEHLRQGHSVDAAKRWPRHDIRKG